jgi:hypothetical protein
MGDLSPSRARSLAALAFLFTYPLVMNYRDMYREAIDTSSARFSGGFGRWRHERGRLRGQHASGRPAEEVTCSSIWLDLRAEPWRCDVRAAEPEVQAATRWVDLWGFSLVYDGRAYDGLVPGPVLVSAPRRVRNAPREVVGTLRGESAFVCLRTELHCGDRPSPHSIVLEPVSAHLGRTAPPPPVAVDWWPWRSGTETNDEYWSCANLVLSLVTPNRQDTPILERIAEIGVAAGQPWDATVLSNELAEAVSQGMDDAISDLLEAAAPDIRWRTQLDRRQMDRDYFERALRAVRPVHEVDNA